MTIGYLDADQVEIVKLQAELDLALTNVVLQQRDDKGHALKYVSGRHENESYFVFAAEQAKLKKAQGDRKAKPKKKKKR